MQEVPLTDQSDVFTFCERLRQGAVDVVLFLTGVGAQQVLKAAELRYTAQEFFDQLQTCTLITRGPKPTRVLHDWGLQAAAQAQSPNTWQELLVAIDATVNVQGQQVAVQEYGIPNPELYNGLEARGAHILPVPVYRWELPDDVRPLQTAISRTVAGDFDVLLFTSASQIQHVLMVAERMNLRTEWLQAAQGCVIGSVGPTCSAALLAAGLPPTVEADPPKMGPLVRCAISAADGSNPPGISSQTPDC